MASAISFVPTYPVLATVLGVALTTGVSGREPARGGPERPVAAADTLFPVSRGSHLVLENLQGEIHVESWDEARVSIGAGDGEAAFRIEGGERVTTVGPRDPRDRNRRHDYRIKVPAWLGLSIRGRSVDVLVEGVEGGVEVRTVSGDVTVRRAAGPIRASSVDGEVVVEDARGEIRVRSLGDDVRVARSSGRIHVDATDGDLQLLELDASELEASTLDGEIEFSGRVREGGRYALTTHDGDVTVTVVGELRARISVSTFDGSFESDFELVTDRYLSGREMEFTVAGGGAELVLRAFDGDIRLRRR